MSQEKAMFGAGCFWGVEAMYREIPGVIDVRVGYAGGHLDNPTYKEVCTDTTGHAEVVQVTFDPTVVSYPELVHAFWEIHDPTTLNRQGPDYGSQYRSVIFTFSDEQAEQATASRDRAQAYFDRKIVTAIEPAPPFYEGEDYHQQYFAKTGLPSCHRRQRAIPKG